VFIDKFEVKEEVRVKKNYFLPLFFRIVGSLLVVFLIFFLVIRPCLAAIYLKDFQDKTGRLNRFSYYEINESVQKIKPLVIYSPQEIYFRFQLVQIYFSFFQWARNDESRQMALEKAQKELLLIHQRDPYDFHYYLESGELYRFWTTFDQGKFALADEFYQKSIELSPKFPLSYFLRGKLYFEAEMFTEAKEYFYRSLSLYPSLDDERFIQEGDMITKQYIAEIYYYLSLTCQELQEGTLAEKYHQRSMEIDPEIFKSQL
jgi:tetratricopeptide (TPR) repeat protein